MENSTVCSGVGNCTAPDQCVCPTGYLGYSCETHTCYGLSQYAENVCHKHGNCTALDVCTCDPAYGGFDCEHPLKLVLIETFPQTARLDAPIKLIAQDLTLIDCELECVFIYGDQVKNVTPIANDTTSITCNNPIQAVHDARISVTAKCTTDTSTNSTMLYFLFIDPVQIESKMNISQLGCDETSDVPGSSGCPQNMTILDQGSIIMSSEFNETTKVRRALKSLVPTAILNQQAVVEFRVATTTTAKGNVVEGWLSSPGSYAVVAFENIGTKSLTLLLNSTGQIGYAASACSFEYGTTYRLTLLASPLRTTWSVTGHVFEIPSLIQVCSVQYVIPAAWNFQVETFFKNSFSVVVSQSNILLKTYATDTGRRVEAGAVTGGTMTVSINRMTVECQPGYCGGVTTKAPTVLPTGTLKPTIISHFIDNWVSYMLSGLIGGVLLVIIIIASLLIFLVVRRIRNRTTKVGVYHVPPEAEEQAEQEELDIPKDTLRIMDEEEEAEIFKMVHK
jgi:hypothetical protein